MKVKTQHRKNDDKNGTVKELNSSYNPFTSYDTSGQYYNMLTKSEQARETMKNAEKF